MKSNRLLLLELARTIPARGGGVTEQRLLHSLSYLVGAMTEQFTAMLRSVPRDAQSLQLSITVNAIGERIGLESSISTTPLGDSSAISPSLSDSSRFGLPKSWQDQLEKELAPTPSPTPLSRAGGQYHPWNPWREATGNDNCIICDMPRTAFQHEVADA